MRSLVFLSLILLVGCPESDSRSVEQRAREEFEEAARTPQGIVAGRFARLLVSGEFDQAAAMLDPALRETTTASSLAADYARMIAYAEGPADQVQEITFLDDWPDRQSGDLGWAHVAISGPAFNEAVSVVVTKAGQIRQIEWGRP